MPTAPPRIAALAGVALLDVAVLVICLPQPVQTFHHLRGPHAWLATAGSDQASIELGRIGLWLAALWFLLGASATLAASCPGATGRAAAAVSGRTLPTALRTILAGSIGLSVTLTPLAAGAVPSHGGAAQFHAGAAQFHAGAAPFHAGAASGPAGSGPVTDSRVPPTSLATPSEGLSRSPGGASRTFDVPWPSGGAVPGADRAEGNDVTVGPGDSLWVIAAHRLGTEGHDDASVSREWPRWYRANVGIVGPDPDVIHPGQRLHPPSPRGRPS